MTNLRGMPQFASWSVPQCHVVVEYDLDVIEKIRYDCYRAENQPGAGEVVGLLLGTYDGVQVRIAAHLPFKLQRSGLRGFAEQARTYTHRGPEGQVVVGWYHLARNTGSDLTVEELAVHDQVFSQPWNVALLLRAGESGAIHSRFYLAYPKNADEETAVEVRRPAPAAEPQAEIAAIPPARPAQGPRWVWGVLGSLLAAALAGIIYMGSATRPQAASAPRPDAVRLNVLNRGGTLDVSWDTRAFDGLPGAQLEIRDSARNTQVPLDPKALADGHYAIVPNSDITAFRIRGKRTDGSIVEGATTYVMPAAKPGAPAESDVVAEAREALRTRDKEQSVEPEPLTGEAERTKPAKKEPASKLFSPPPAHLAQARVPDPGVLPEPSVALQQPEVSVRIPSVPSQTPPAAPKPTAPTTTSVPRAAQPALANLSGSWAWKPGSQTRSPGTPERVEVRVSDTSAGISGTVDARYKAKGKTDHVIFSFSGKMVQGRASFPWTSSDGRHGQVELIRLPELPNSLELVWSRSGSSQVFDDLLTRR